MMLDGLEALLGTVPNLHLVGRCTNGQAAVKTAGELKPDLVIMDVNMPGMDGIEATRRLLKASPESRVLILSMYGHKEFVLEVMEAGAYGYLLKNVGKEELRAAMRGHTGRPQACGARAAPHHGAWRPVQGPPRRERLPPAEQTRAASGAPHPGRTHHAGDRGDPLP
ncbi:MAG: response regulator transcription factor [Flavobacteriales bacterium]|nr:response regulator transcription factor [Flavobacteriales bacterium]